MPVILTLIMTPVVWPSPVVIPWRADNATHASDDAADCAANNCPDCGTNRSGRAAAVTCALLGTADDTLRIRCYRCEAGDSAC